MMSLFKGKEQGPPVAESLPKAAPDSSRDPLTGLLSTAAFAEACRAALDAAGAGENVGVALFSFDGMRELTARAGNLVTDKLLRELGKRLNDTVREGDHVGRFERDQFIVIFRGLGGRLETLGLVSRLRVSLAEPISSGKDGYVPIVNCGLAYPPSDGSTLEALIEVAERAMLLMRDQARQVAKEKAVVRLAEARAAVAAAIRHVSESELHVREADNALAESKRLLVHAKADVTTAIEHARALGLVVVEPPAVDH